MQFERVCVLESNAHSSMTFATLLCSIIGMLMAKGYMELEETLMQWKQKTHLLRVLEVSGAALCCIIYASSPLQSLACLKEERADLSRFDRCCNGASLN